MFGNLTLNDLLFYVDNLTNRLQEEQKNRTQDKMAKCLINIRDTLNYMTFDQTSNN